VTTDATDPRGEPAPIGDPDGRAGNGGAPANGGTAPRPPAPDEASPPPRPEPARQPDGPGAPASGPYPQPPPPPPAPPAGTSGDFRPPPPTSTPPAAGPGAVMPAGSAPQTQATASPLAGGPAPAAAPPAAPGPGRPLPRPFTAVVGYTLRACLPARRWWGIVLPCLGALLFGWLATLVDLSLFRAFAIVAREGLFGLVLPLTCLVVGDAVLGADLRAGTFPFTWLSPVSFRTIVAGRWLGGWLVALVTLVPAMMLAVAVAGLPQNVGAIAVATAAGSAAYIGLFVMLGVVVRRSAVWALAVVFLGERLLGSVLSSVAQISPMWEAQQVYAGLAREDGGWRLLRHGTPNGWPAVLRLAIIAVVTLAIAAWRLGQLRPTAGDE